MCHRLEKKRGSKRWGLLYLDKDVTGLRETKFQKSRSGGKSTKRRKKSEGKGAVELRLNGSGFYETEHDTPWRSPIGGT